MLSRTALSLPNTQYNMRKRAAGQSAEASVWLFAKGASQIAHLCVVEPRKDLTYRATGLHWLCLPLGTLSYSFLLFPFLSTSSCHPLRVSFLYLRHTRKVHTLSVIIKSEMTSIKATGLFRISIRNTIFRILPVPWAKSLILNPRSADIPSTVFGMAIRFVHHICQT